MTPEAVREAGLTPDQVDAVQAWLLHQHLAKGRRAQRGSGWRRPKCIGCGKDRKTPLTYKTAKTWGKCQACKGSEMSRIYWAKKGQGAA